MDERNYPNFKKSEMVCKCDGLCDHVDLPCTELMESLQALRTALDVPLRVNSCMRCAEHNHNVGGAPQSKHLFGLAVDVRLPKGMTIDGFVRGAENVEAFLNGGIGRYNTFVHLDVRGRHARWDNRT